MTNYSNERAFGSNQSSLTLTPSQRLAAIEHAQALRRGRAKATARVCGVGFLVFASSVLSMMRLEEFVVGAAFFGVIISIVAIWSGGFDSSNRVLQESSRQIDPRALKDLDERLTHLETLDQRLSNLETIASYEEKVAARNRQIEGAQD